MKVMGNGLKLTESQEQVAVVEYCEWRRIPCFHIPNGGHREKHTAYQMKRQGVKAGVPDLCIPVARKGFHGLYIEMKRADGGRPTAEQRGWLRLLVDNGYCAEVCHGAEEAIALIDGYMS